jgi:phthalate 4,5-dioxygenase
MLTAAQNELLTRTGANTPCGELLRRYWQPVALSEELRDGDPMPVRLLGEDLVLFRDDTGRLGLLGLHCSHRGADLSYGRIEDGGLRCLYHGWLYDVSGRCLEQPGEPEGSTFCDKVRQQSYPCQERNGVVFAYLGPGEPPLLPGYDFLTVPEDHTMVLKLWHECNYLQANEGNLDFLHVSFLHYGQHDTFPSPLPPDSEKVSSRGAAPKAENMEVDVFDYGLRLCKIRRLDEETNYIRVGTFIMPNMVATPGGQTNWHVPVDDHHHWKYTFIFDSERPLDREQVLRTRAEMTPDYRPLQNKGNRYLQDRASMNALTYAGMGRNFQVHDLYATEGQGFVQDRTNERLAPSDIAITTARKMLFQAIQAVQRGSDPPGVTHDRDVNRRDEVVTTFGSLPASSDWKDHCRRLAGEGRGWQSRYARTQSSTRD